MANGQEGEHFRQISLEGDRFIPILQGYCQYHIKVMQVKLFESAIYMLNVVVGFWGSL